MFRHNSFTLTTLILLLIISFSFNQNSNSSSSSSSESSSSNFKIPKTCGERNSTECVKGNNALLHLGAGLCCLDRNDKCVYIPSEKANPFQLNEQGLDCDIMANDCEKETDVGTKEYSKCYNKLAPKPYSCCYVGSGRHNRCMLLDTHDKKVYQETIYYMRTMNEDYDGDYEIECSSFFINKRITLLTGILLSILYMLI